MCKGGSPYKKGVRNTHSVVVKKKPVENAPLPRGGWDSETPLTPGGRNLPKNTQLSGFGEKPDLLWEKTLMEAERPKFCSHPKKLSVTPENVAT